MLTFGKEVITNLLEGRPTVGTSTVRSEEDPHRASIPHWYPWKAREGKRKRWLCSPSLGQQDPRVALKQTAPVWRMGLRWVPKAAIASQTARGSAVTMAQTTLKESQFCHRQKTLQTGSYWRWNWKWGQKEGKMNEEML